MLFQVHLYTIHSLPVKTAISQHCGSQTFQYWDPLFKMTIFWNSHSFTRLKIEFSPQQPLKPLFYDWVGCLLMNSLNSTFIRVGPFWWPCIPLCLAFSKSQGMFAYSRVNVHMRLRACLLRSKSHHSQWSLLPDKNAASVSLSIGLSAFYWSAWRGNFLLKVFWGAPCSLDQNHSGVVVSLSACPLKQKHVHLHGL